MTCPRCGTVTDSWPCPGCGFPEVMYKQTISRRLKKSHDKVRCVLNYTGKDMSLSRCVSF